MSALLSDLLADRTAMDSFISRMRAIDQNSDGAVNANQGFCSPSEFEDYLAQQPVATPEQEGVISEVFAGAARAFE